MIPTTAKIVISQPSYGISPSGFPRLHVEMLPREVGRLIGYDPRVLVMRPKKAGAKGTRDTLPHNVSHEIVTLQNNVQRSIDSDRVVQMVDYLLGSQERDQFADWGAIELVTISKPDLSALSKDHTVSLDSDADYFIADGQHRYCALLDFIQEYPQYSDRFTQSVTISILPEAKLTQWAGQEFHDRNYFSVPVRAGKALSVDTRDPINAIAKDLANHEAILRCGGVAYERDALLAGDPRFITHSMLHRFVRGFVFGRPGLDKGVDTRAEIRLDSKKHLWEFVSALAQVLPWNGGDPKTRDEYLTRTSVVLSSLAVVGSDIYTCEPAIPEDVKVKKFLELGRLDWRKTNLGLVGVVGSEKNGLVAPASSRQAIDSTIRYLRDKLGLAKAN